MKLTLTECATYAALTFGSVFLAVIAASPAYKNCSSERYSQATLKPRLVAPYVPDRASYQFPIWPSNGLGTGP